MLGCSISYKNLCIKVKNFKYSLVLGVRSIKLYLVIDFYTISHSVEFHQYHSEKTELIVEKCVVSLIFQIRFIKFDVVRGYYKISSFLKFDQHTESINRVQIYIAGSSF